MTDQRFWANHVKQHAVLDPIDRTSEVLFGLIMVLTFTGTISAATDGRQEIRDLLWAALGCNLAWGLVDAVMYLMNVALERGHNITVISKLINTNDAMASRQGLREEMQPLFTALMTDAELDELGNRLKTLPLPSKRNLLTGRDILAGLEIFLLVFLCTLPVAIPFALLDEVNVAMRTSNGVALLLLFTGGFMLAGYAGFRRIITGLVYALIGVSLVALTMALGG
jgi:hypothetical protein